MLESVGTFFGKPALRAAFRVSASVAHMSQRREDLLKKLIEAIVDLRIDHPARVAIDRVDASGKTYLANELADRLKCERLMETQTRYAEQVSRI